MASRYMYIDSTFRNRQQDPNPASFVVKWGWTDRASTDILDPILDAATFLEGGVLQAGSIINTAVLDVAASAVDDAFNGFFIKLTSGPGANQFAQITDYDGATQTATLGSNWVAPIAAGPAAGTNYQIFRGRDNFHPLIYNGTNEVMTCWAVQLLTLSLPNDPMLTTESEVFVQIRSMQQRNTAILVSNNPNSRDATFVVPIDDKQIPFMQLKNSRMYQTIKFKPDDDLIFRVFLRDGTQLFFTDMFAPDPPDPLVQISAQFLLRQQPMVSSDTR